MLIKLSRSMSQDYEAMNVISRDGIIENTGQGIYNDDNQQELRHENSNFRSTKSRYLDKYRASKIQFSDLTRNMESKVRDAAIKMDSIVSRIPINLDWKKKLLQNKSDVGKIGERHFGLKEEDVEMRAQLLRMKNNHKPSDDQIFDIIKLFGDRKKFIGRLT